VRYAGRDPSTDPPGDPSGAEEAPVDLHQQDGEGKPIPVESLNPDTAEGRKNLDSFLTSSGRHYTISGLGAPEEKGAINWRILNHPLRRRILLQFLWRYRSS